MHTPWGNSDHQRELAPGIVFYSTPSHGGVHLDPEQNKQVHTALRNRNGWYEEDCEIEKVCYTFPALFPKNDVQRTIAFLKNYEPEAFAKVQGKAVDASESYRLREAKFYADNAENYIVFSAIGSGSHDPSIPEGMVKCSATLGKHFVKRGNFYQWTAVGECEFLVPDEEYGSRGEHSFVIDTTKHKRLEGITV